MLEAVGDSSLASDATLDAIARLGSTASILEQLRGVAAKVFRSLFTDGEWNELEASERATADDNGTEAQVRALRLKRQHFHLMKTRELAVDLTAREEQEEELVRECVEAVQGLLDRVGVNARGASKRPRTPKTPRTLRTKSTKRWNSEWRRARC